MNLESAHAHDKYVEDGALYVPGNAPGNTYAEASSEPAIKRYGFCIQGIHLLAPQNVYCELIPNFHPSPLPNAPDYVLGLINLRGNLLPVYQLGKRDKHATSASTAEVRHKKYALLIGQVSKSAALVIDDKPQAITLSDESTSSTTDNLPEWLSSSINGSFIIDGTTWHDLDAKALFRHLAGR